MSTVAKTIIGFGAVVGREDSYGAGADLDTSVTHSVQGAAPPSFDIEYSYDGTRPAPPSTYGTIQYASPTGETATGEIVVEGRGLGEAYSTASTPPNLFYLLEAAGFTGSYDSNAWTFTPVEAGTTPRSVAMKIWTRGERYDISGSYANLSIASEDGSPPQFTFPFNGLPAEPVDETLPTITYNSTQPPKAEDIGLTYGAVTDLIVRSFNIDLNREISPRLDQNASSGSAGFAVGRREPELSMTVEALPLSTFDPYAEMKSKETKNFEMTVGKTQYNRYTISGSAQVTGVAKGEDGPVATWDLTMAIVLEDGSTADDLLFIFD